MVDYNERYDEVVLGKRTINWGNVILAMMIVMLVAGGGVFVYANERNRRGLPFMGAKAVPSSRLPPPTRQWSKGIPLR